MQLSDAEKIKLIRLQYLKLSQIGFAKSIGITQSSLSDIERGRYSITSDAVTTMVKTYGINPEWWFFDKEPIFLADLKKEVSVSKDDYDKLKQENERLKDELLDCLRKNQ